MSLQKNICDPEADGIPRNLETVPTYILNSSSHGTKKTTSPDRSKEGDTMKIGFIGAGKVGFSLGKFFAEGGIQVTGYYSRHQESAQQAAQFTNSRFYDGLDKLIKDSDALFLTVPDGTITSVYDELKCHGISGKQICHCSGAMTAEEAFPDISLFGAHGYSIHPLFPVSSKLETYRELPGAFFCIEGNGPHLSTWQTMLSTLGPTVQVIPTGTKTRYHAACAISSNLVCALVHESLELLETCGFSKELALQALTPLIRSNTEHILQDGPIGALTGPMERCDTKTVEKHLSCFPSEEERELYRAVSQKLMETAQAKHPETDYTYMEKILKEGNEN